MAETWLPWCQKRPGDRSRTGYFLKSTRSLAEIRYQVNHSAEGWEAYLRAGSAPGASWTFSNLQGGKMYQHYPLELPTWTSGGRRQNIDGLAVEHEGVAGQLLNAAQVTNDRRLYEDLNRLCPNMRIPRLGEGFREHGELTNGATACPSGRIQPLYDSYAVVQPPTPPNVWDDIVTIPTKQVTLYVDANLRTLPAGVNIKTLPKGTVLTVSGRYKNSHYLTKYSMDNKKSNGFAISATIDPTPPPLPPEEDDMMKYVAFKGFKAIYALAGGELIHVPNPPVMSYQMGAGNSWSHETHDVNDPDPAKKALARALADLPTQFGKLPKALGGV